MTAADRARRMKCDYCTDEAAFTVTAAYPACDTTHPHFATYPMPLARTCGIHLSTTIARDHSLPGATPSYLVRPL